MEILVANIILSQLIALRATLWSSLLLQTVVHMPYPLLAIIHMRDVRTT